MKKSSTQQETDVLVNGYLGGVGPEGGAAHAAQAPAGPAAVDADLGLLRELLLSGPSAGRSRAVGVCHSKVSLHGAFA